MNDHADPVVAWETTDGRPRSASLSISGAVVAKADVPQWPPEGWPAGAPESLSGLAREAGRKPDYFQQRLHAELQRRGRGLWDCLFPGDVGRAILQATAGLGSRRLVLATDDQYLLSLPLEAAVPPDGNLGIGCDPRLIVVRRLAGPEPDDGVPAGPLRIVVAVQSPDEDKASGAVLNYEAAQWVLLEALDRPIAEDRAFVEFLDEGHLAAVTDAVGDLDPQVLHISGHGLPGGLAFEGPDGEEALVTATTLASALRAHRGIRLLVLSACLSGTDAMRQGQVIEPAVARALIAAGFPAVLAMQASVTDTFATRLWGEFYERLGRGMPPCAALAEARHEVATAGTDAQPVGEWAAPVLYEGCRPLALFDAKEHWLPRPQRTWPGWEGVSFRPRGQFVGRRRHRRQALRGLRAHDGVGLVWHGIGGVGKSTLSTHVAERLMQADDYRVLVFTAEQTPARLIEEFESRLRFWAQEEVDRGHLPRADQLRRHARHLTPEGGLDERGRWNWLKEKILAREKVLVVFDNFEDNLAGVPTREKGTGSERSEVPVPFSSAFSSGQELRFALKDAELDRRLRDLLAVRGRARMLFTSRYPFGLDGGRRLCGLEESHLGPLSQAEAWKMMHNLPRLRGLKPEEKEEAYRTVGGHPRCLEYLNAHLDGERRWPAEAPGLRRAITEKTGLGAVQPEKWNDALARTVALAAEDVLLDRLLERIAGRPARELLDRAAVFRQPVDRFGLERAAERPVDGSELDALDRLSLLWREGGRFMVPQVTATSLLERLEQTEVRAAHARAAAYFEHRARNYDASLGNWLAVRHHLLAAGRDEKAHEIAFAAEDWLSLRGHVGEAEALARETYELAKKAGRSEARAGAANRLGLLAYARGDVPEAICCHEESLALARAAGVRLGEGAALDNLGLACADLGDTRKAIEYHEQQKAIVREIGDRKGECIVLGNLGNAWRKSGETEKARDCLGQGLRLALSAADPLRSVQVAWYLAPNGSWHRCGKLWGGTP